MARYISLYSGSSGNCSVVEEGGRFIIIDMGKSARITNAALSRLGLEVKNLQAVLVSHEHSDHISGLKVFLKNLDVPLFSGAPTNDYLRDNSLVPGHTRLNDLNFSGTDIGPFHIQGFETPHDSMCCLGFRIDTDCGSSMSIATDLGFVNDSILENLSGVNLSVVESNYDVAMLKNGPYPYYLKTRIASNRGHLSNLQSSRASLRLIESGVKKLHLCHLSNTNNTPRLALERIQQTALSGGIKIEDDVTVKVNRRHEITPPTEF